MKKMKPIIPIALALTLGVGVFAAGSFINTKQIGKSTPDKVSNAVEDYLNEYSVEMKEYAADNGTGESPDTVYVLTKEESGKIAETVYQTLQEDWVTGDAGLTDEQLANLQSRVYASVYDTLKDRVESVVIDDVYENIMAICLNDIYNYSDRQDATLKAALEEQLASLTDDLLGVDSKITANKNDYEVVTNALKDSIELNAKDLQTLDATYDSLSGLVSKNATDITSNKASIAALEKSNKDTADALNKFIAESKSDVAQTGDTLTETIENYYEQNSEEIEALRIDINNQKKTVAQSIKDLSNSTDASVTQLNTQTTTLRSDIDALVEQLKNTDETTINQTVLDINAKLANLFAAQNTDVTTTITNLRKLLEQTDDPEMKAMIQQLLLELEATNAEKDTVISDILSTISGYNNASSDAERATYISKLLTQLNTLKTEQPDVYNSISTYVNEIMNGDYTHLGDVQNALNNVLIEHNKNYSEILAKCVNLINNSNLADTETGKSILQMIKNLQNNDTSIMQNTLSTTIQNLFNSYGSDSDAMIAAINAAIDSLSGANQDNANMIANVNNEMSEELVRVYSSLSSDLKLQNENLTNEIYNNYLTLYGLNSSTFDTLDGNIADVANALTALDASTNAKLDDSIATLSDNFTQLTDEKLQALQESDAVAYQALVDAMTALEEAKNSDVSTLHAENENYYKDLSDKLSAAQDALTSQSEEDYTSLIAEIGSVSTELSARQEDDVTKLLAKLKEVGDGLAEADETNKAETITMLMNLQDELANSDEQLLETLRQEDADAYATLTGSMTSLSDSLTETLDSNYAALVAKDLENLNLLKEADAANMAELSDADTDLGNRIDTLEAKQESDKQALDTQMQQVFTSVSNGKAQLASAITDKSYSTAEDASWDTLTRNINAIGSETTASASNILDGQVAYLGNEYVTGTMNDEGAVNEELLAGESFTVPLNTHFDSLTISAVSLADQTSATATAADVLDGKTVWINGSEVTGTMPNNGPIAETIGLGESYEVPAGYTTGGRVACELTMAGLTPGTATAADILQGKTAWVNGVKVTGTLNTSSTETYKFPSGSKGTKVDLGADNKVRYVDGTAVYTTGYNAGYAQTKTVAKEYVNLLYNHSVSNTTKTWSTASGYVTSKSTKSDVRKYGATHTGSSSKITLVDTINSKPALVYSLSFTYREESDIPTGGASGSADVYIYLYDSNNNQLASFRGKTTNAKTTKSHTITILPLNYNIATDEIYVTFRLESDAKGRGSSHSSTSVWLQLDSTYTVTYYTPVA